jgi:L-ascorbate metabolism protein UlaG (beta-lactamase superfamily)
MVIHIDPVSREYDYSKLPDADLILVTHQHGDHLDAKALDEIVDPGTTKVVMTEKCVENLEHSYDAVVMKNGDKKNILGVDIEALPAYNIEHKRSNGQPYHPRGMGNAYVLTLENKKVLIGGDTENVPELKALEDIDIAFLPMNLPYTMTPEMVADIALAIKPKVLYPYHYGNTDPQELVDLLADHPEIEVRIRDLR